MSTTTLHHEILLMTGTSFSSRQCLQKMDEDNQKYLSEMEQLQEACWNGQLPEMLPEICKTSATGKALFLWEIKQNRSGLEIILSETPDQTESEFSIDPYLFLSAQVVN